jgi:colanic acid biosynthesis protein WcaH
MQSQANSPNHLSREDFLKIIDLTPLVSIDLLIRNPAEEILMGLRNNEPAKGMWFVPGGRILKNETLPQAFARITQAELGMELPFAEAHLQGAYTHLYPTNALQAAHINTHYVVLAYQIQISELPLKPDTQHREMRWFPQDKAQIPEDLRSKIHSNNLTYW